jgi:hypothetical protein
VTRSSGGGKGRREGKKTRGKFKERLEYFFNPQPLRLSTSVYKPLLTGLG